MALVETDAKTAIMHLQARYSSLSVYAQKIMDIRRKAGIPLNCQLIDDYHQAVNDYLEFGNSFFLQMRAQNYKIQQVVYKNGKIAADPNNPKNALVVTIDRPLRPPVFTLSNGFCPTSTKVPPPPTNVRGISEMGVLPLVAVAVYAIAAILVVGVAGYVAVKILEQIKLVLHGPDYDPDKRVDASIKYFDSLVAKGVTPQKAAEMANMATQPPPPTAFSQWTGPIIFGALALVGAFMFLGKKGGGGGSVPSTAGGAS
jgi:hypothetical protein